MNNTYTRIHKSPLGALLLLTACSLGIGEVNITTTGATPAEPADESGEDTFGSEDTTEGTTGSTGAAGSSEGSEGESTTGEALDDTTGALDTSGESSGEPMGCAPPDHVPCDAGTFDPFRAIGVNCPGEWAVDDSMAGSAASRGVRQGFGSTAAWAPREGASYAVIGSGIAAELDNPTPNGDSNENPTHCNDDLGPYDPGSSLPPPISVDDPTIAGRFSDGVLAQDYSEIRFATPVPDEVTSFSYDFAFLSTEYPYYYGSDYNDIYIAWLESELWTGNISFSDQGDPVSLNAGYLDYAGDDPELAGTCMFQHAATSWLTTTAGVTPGEDITVVFGIFDMGSSSLDSYAFIDNFEWGCEILDSPVTTPG